MQEFKALFLRMRVDCSKGSEARHELEKNSKSSLKCENEYFFWYFVVAIILSKSKNLKEIEKMKSLLLFDLNNFSALFPPSTLSLYPFIFYIYEKKGEDE